MVKKKHVTTKSLTKRSRKLSHDEVKNKMSALLGTAEGEEDITGVEESSEIDSVKRSSMMSGSNKSSTFLSKLKIKEQKEKKDSSQPSKKKPIEIVGKGSSQIVVAEVDDSKRRPERTIAEAKGAKLLNQAVKTQNHLRPLPHQERHDFEYRLRHVATAGVVRMFNSLKAAQRAGDEAMKEVEKTVTIDKAQEKKLIASRDAFLAALTKPRETTDDSAF